ncbi:MAG: hypothetical protein A2277_09735 [Desulfobacterales bacterium RIFOXYA12_FULL_46_15]|nr:MAG: hypothetical protein A2097_13300 [Desulfobacula sp. GWF2_41_7]OGR25697.1 MAG: hypothetical protein A2277_09735 [Desulfobacterales bacterium RIFOXYA12_FULL_46_15]
MGFKILSINFVLNPKCQGEIKNLPFQKNSSFSRVRDFYQLISRPGMIKGMDKIESSPGGC